MSSGIYSVLISKFEYLFLNVGDRLHANKPAIACQELKVILLNRLKVEICDLRLFPCTSIYSGIMTFQLSWLLELSPGMTLSQTLRSSLAATIPTITGSQAWQEFSTSSPASYQHIGEEPCVTCLSHSDFFRHVFGVACVSGLGCVGS